MKRSNNTKKGLAMIGNARDAKTAVMKLQLISYLSLLALAVSVICNLIMFTR